MAAKNYSNIAVETALASGIAGGDLSLVVLSAAGWPATPFTLVIDPDTASEELILVNGKAGTTFSSLTRGYGGTSGVAHNAGAEIKHVIPAEDHRLIWEHNHGGGAGDDTAIVSHDVLSGVSPNDHHNELHTVASHSDTGATGPELNTLTDGSDADALHTHPLLASDSEVAAIQAALQADIDTHASRHATAGADDLGSEFSGYLAIDATRHAGSITLTESYQDAALLSFVKPASWATFAIIAWGMAHFSLHEHGSTATMRINIGGTGSIANQGQISSPPTNLIVPYGIGNSLARSGLTTNVSVSVQVLSSFLENLVTYLSSTVSYIAIRTS